MKKYLSLKMIALIGNVWLWAALNHIWFMIPIALQASRQTANHRGATFIAFFGHWKLEINICATKRLQQKRKELKINL